MILGASTRAAAWSAWRAGFQPVCVDLFLDQDLREIAEVHPLSDYPSGFAEAVVRIPTTPWIYTGGLENYPEILARIAITHPLYGTPPEVVAQVRDPFWLNRFCREHSFAVPRVLPGHSAPPLEEPWLLKPLQGSGGRNIRHWTPQSQSISFDPATHFFQEYRHGTPCSALFLAGSQETKLLATFEQLIGQPQPTNLPPFLYSGSIFPSPIPRSAHRELIRLGTLLTEEAPLEGLFGIDFLWSEETLWLLEVNPRYTASVELDEFATGQPHLADHCACFTEGSRLPDPSPSPSKHSRYSFLAKQILYAPVSLQIETFPSSPANRETPWSLPQIADLPIPRTEIAAGDPICTLFAAGSDRESLLLKLDSAGQSLLHHLGVGASPSSN